jgi:hypothetical protein
MRLRDRVYAMSIAAALNTGCVQQTAPTVEYYRAHQEERMALLAQCTNEAARSKDNPACVNAREAERLDSIGRLRDLPPVGLSPRTPTQEDEEQSGQRKD